MQIEENSNNRYCERNKR